MNCTVCGEATHKARRCPELRSPLKDGFQGGGGGGGHSHDDDEDERLGLVLRGLGITNGQISHNLLHEILPVPTHQGCGHQSQHLLKRGATA
jgi:hypothetical protein